MKAAVWHGYKDVRIEEVIEPAVKQGYVKIKVEYAGICGTDRHEYLGPNFIPVEKPHRLTGKVAPLTIGHEFSGEIVEIGEGVTGFQVGDKVTANGSMTCKECEPCKTGRYNICKKLGFLGVNENGAFAEYVLVEGAKLFLIPSGVSQKEAVLAEPLACGIHATSLVDDILDKDVLIIGPGIIGLSAFFAAKLAGAGRILVSGIGSDRKALIEKYGGEYIDSSIVNLYDYVDSWSQGKLIDVVYECVGLQATLNQGITLVKPGGKLMVMGVFEKPPVIDMNTLQEAERTLLTSQAHVGEIAVALNYIKEKKINAQELITGEITLDTLVADGFEALLENPAKHIKIVVKV